MNLRFCFKEIGISGRVFCECTGRRPDEMPRVPNLASWICDICVENSQCTQQLFVLTIKT